MDDFDEEDAQKKRRRLKLDYVDWQPYSRGYVFPPDKGRTDNKDNKDINLEDQQ